MGNGYSDLANGDVSKLKGYLNLAKDIWNTFGLPTIILVVILLLWTGYIQSPLSDAKVLVEDIKVSLDRHVEGDREIIFYMREMCISNAKLAKTPIEDCFWKQQ